MLSWGFLYYASEWIVRLVMLVYVPQRRSPAAARAWLLLILLLPWVGLALYALIGRPYLPRRRQQLQMRVLEFLRRMRTAHRDEWQVPSKEYPASIAPAATLAMHLAEFELLRGNRFELLPEYSNAIERLVADINSAREHVHLLYYIFGSDAIGNRLAEALVVARQRGVTCRVLMDASGSKRALRTIAPRLRDAGIAVHAALPVHFPRRHGSARFDLRNHRKIAVIDGRIAYAGSQNLVSPDFKPPLVYEELVCRVTGPVVRQLQAVFLADEYFETEQLIDPASCIPASERAGDSLALALPSGPGYPYSNNLDVIVSLIYAAQRRIVITSPYFVPSEGFLQAIQAAAVRGVELHLIVSSQIDQFFVGFAQRSYYAALLACGVKVHLYKPRFLHAKHLSFDDEVAVIGSSNMDMRSFGLNAEISLLIHDPAVVLELREIQDRYIRDSETLSRESWSHRPLRSKLAENVARLTDSLL